MGQGVIRFDTILGGVTVAEAAEDGVSSGDSITQRINSVEGVSDGARSADVVFDALPGLQDGPAILPLITPSLTQPGMGGSVIDVDVDHGGSIAAALAAASAGDMLDLTPGSLYAERLVINKSIEIRTKLHGTIPGDKIRVQPGDSYLAKIDHSTTSPVIWINAGVSKVVLKGLHLQVPTSMTANVTRMVRYDGGGSTTPAALPREIYVDHCLLRTHDNVNVRRGFEANGGDMVWKASDIGEIHDVGNAGQAITAWNGFQEVLVYNCRLSSAGVTFNTGGSGNQGVVMNSQDIIMRKTLIEWEPRWFDDLPANYNLKNMTESKNSQRTLIEDCVYKNFFIKDQDYAINIKSSNQSTGQDWQGTSDYTFRYIKFVDAPAGVKILANTPGHNSFKCIRISIHDIYMQKSGIDSTYPVQSQSRGLVIFGCPDNTRVANMSLLGPWQFNRTMEFGSFLAGGVGFELFDNICGAQFIGTGPGGGEGTIAFDLYYPNQHDVRGNVFIGRNQGAYPAGNNGSNLAGSEAAALFVDPTGLENWTLQSGSPLKGVGKDGGDPGANIALINSRTSGVETGILP